MKTLALQKKAKELSSLLKKANRKLLEIDILQSELEYRAGEGRIYSSAANFIQRMKAKVN